ncbi:MAG: DUF2303 family protein [Aquabacterium sp.]|uniref:DUF2303 family protein n=1 Tax=Aquabacterium sp. TaxID=1872578 RepID=UPI00271A232F|nr:DUF2303 family protein [Aquabacterium sp.]MDO9006320.1 DUF2303 family protein [Aquabacterium sp.]
MDTTTPENVAQTVAKLLAETADTTLIETPPDLTGGPLLLSVPKDRKVEDHSEAVRKLLDRIQPFARKGTATMTSLQSVIDWANRFKGAESVLYASNAENKPKITCIADYHQQGAPAIGSDGESTARHGQHRATYAFPLSPKWLAWMAMSGQAMSGVDMGAFLEDNILDVIDPPTSLTSPGIAGAEASESDMRLIDIARRLDGTFGNGAQLLGMAKSFTVNETADYTVAHNSTTGEATIQTKSEHIDGSGQPIRVPKLFLIAIPVFENGPPYRLPVRFQYRKAGPTVKFFLTIHDPQHAKDHAFTEATTFAATETELPLFLGTPEV